MDSDEKLNRTLDDIMEDYEGSDSWETLLSKKDGAVIQFKCLKNGQHYFCILGDGGQRMVAAFSRCGALYR